MFFYNATRPGSLPGKSHAKRRQKREQSVTSTGLSIILDYGRKMKFILTSIACLLLIGCVPLQQSEVSGGKKDDYFRYYDEYGLLEIGPSDKKKTVTLIPEYSYALSPKGIKYGIHTEPHFYDLEQKHPYIRDHITLVNPRGKRIGSIPQNGTWHFHFEFIGPRGKDSREFTIRFWTFYYNPIIHGPPN